MAKENGKNSKNAKRSSFFNVNAKTEELSSPLSTDPIANLSTMVTPEPVSPVAPLSGSPFQLKEKEDLPEPKTVISSILQLENGDDSPPLNKNEDEQTEGTDTTTPESTVDKLKSFASKAREAGMPKEGLKAFGEVIASNIKSPGTDLQEELKKVLEKAKASTMDAEYITMIANLIEKGEEALVQTTKTEDNDEENLDLDLIFNPVRHKLNRYASMAKDAGMPKKGLDIFYDVINENNFDTGQNLTNELKKVLERAGKTDLPDPYLKMLFDLITKGEEALKMTPETESGLLDDLGSLKINAEKAGFAEADIMKIDSAITQAKTFQSFIAKLTMLKNSLNMELGVIPDPTIEAPKKEETKKGEDKNDEREYKDWIKTGKDERKNDLYDSWRGKISNSRIKEINQNSEKESFYFKLEGFKITLADYKEDKEAFVEAWLRNEYFQTVISKSTNTESDSKSKKSDDDPWTEQAKKIVSGIFKNWNYMYLHIDPGSEIKEMPMTAKEKAVNVEVPIMKGNISKLAAHKKIRERIMAGKGVEIEEEKSPKVIAELGFVASEIEYLTDILKDYLKIKENPNKQETP